MNHRFYTGLVLILILCATHVGGAQESRPLLRFPDVHEDTVVFVYGEDIWKASTQGGVAQRLTIHDGQERFPKFSPDGSKIAYNRIARETRTWKRYRGGTAQDI